MSKFCQNCGSAMEDQEVFCANCGTQSEAAQAPKKAFPVALIGAAAGVVALVVVLIVIFGGGYKKTLNNYIKVNYKGKVNKIEKLAPKEYWEWLDDESNMDVDDVKEDAEDSYEDTIDYLEEEYGKNIKVSFKEEKKKTLSDKKTEKIAEALDDQYDIDEKSVKKVIEVKGEMTIKGSEDDDDYDVEFTFVKIGSKWYMIDYSQYENKYSVSFTVSEFISYSDDLLGAYGDLLGGDYSEIIEYAEDYADLEDIYDYY